MNQAPADARLLSDLSAAYSAWAETRGSPSTLVLALDKAVRAHYLAPTNPEVVFNLALFQEKLFLYRSSLSSWKAYLELDPDSPWSREAKRHIETLQASLSATEATALQAEFERRASAGDENALKGLVQDSPQIAREYVLEDLLGQWGDAWLGGDREREERLLQIGSGIGSSLKSLSGDPSVEAAVAAIRRAAAEPAGRLGKLARGHQAFREASRSFRDLKIGAAGASFRLAETYFRVSESPMMRLWAQAGQARVQAYEAHYEEAREAFNSVLRAAEAQGSMALAGWCEWGLGWIKLREGDPVGTFKSYRRAAEYYKKAGEEENLGAVEGLIADGLFNLGQSERAWEPRYLALRTLVCHPRSFRLHVVLQESGRSALEAGLADAALAFEDEAVRISETTDRQIQRVESRWSRARVFLALQRPQAALRDLRSAGEILVRVERDLPAVENATVAKLRADLRWIEGEALENVDEGSSRRAFSEALELYHRLKAPTGLINAHLGLSSLEFRTGRMADGLRSLSSALELIEKPAASIADRQTLASYAMPAQKVYDELITRQVEAGDFEGALRTLEKARGIFAGMPEASSHALDNIGEVARSLPPNITVAVYGIAGGRLYRWLLTDRQVHFSQTKIAPAAFKGLIGRFLTVLQGGATAGDSEPETLAARLYTMLFSDTGGLKPGAHLYLVPDTSLRALPFAALRNPETGRFLVQDHAITVSPSLSSLFAAPRIEFGPTRRPSVLLVNNPALDHVLFPNLPDLKGDGVEFNALKSGSFDFTQIQGKEATRERLQKELPGFDIFIYSGHSGSKGAGGGNAYLALAPGPSREDSGLGDVRDLMSGGPGRLKLAVLASCNFVEHDAARSGNLFGLAQSFLDSGVETVVGSLWQVGDANTADLMSRFYARLAMGEAPAQALQKVQVGRLDQARPLRDARVWSAFEVFETGSLYAHFPKGGNI